MGRVCRFCEVPLLALGHFFFFLGVGPNLTWRLDSVEQTSCQMDKVAHCKAWLSDLNVGPCNRCILGARVTCLTPVRDRKPPSPPPCVRV